MTELFEVISEDEFVAETSVGVDHSLHDLGKRSEGSQGLSLQVDPHNALIYCEFCKGYYNEHHYGREVDDDH